VLVLRHQVKVLRRKVRQATFRRMDRLFLAAASRALPRSHLAWPRCVSTLKHSLVPCPAGIREDNCGFLTDYR
jgi:hypothetical protein